MRTFVTAHLDRRWRDPALWLGLFEATTYMALLGYFLNIVRSALGG
jgi:hypothetical protein